MTRVRILPVATAAAASLLVLKGIGLVTNGHFVLGGSVPAVAAGGGGHGAPASPPAAPPPDPSPPVGTEVDLGEPHGSDAELLARLAERRRALEARERELDQREALLQATEKRVKARIAELEALQNEIAAAVAAKEDARAAELKGVVAMYEAMKPKDAARIFDRLDLAVVADIAKQMKPTKMAGIVAEMAPEAAERLTLELAGPRAAREPAPDLAKLPKIGETP